MRGWMFGGGNLVIGVLASVGLGWLAVRGLRWDEVADQIVGISLPLLVLSVALFMFASYVRAVRWRFLFVDHGISSARLFIIQNEGIGLNNVVPFRVASEATQFAVLKVRDRVDGATALATLGMERVIDVVASTLILGVAFFVIPEMADFKAYAWGALGFSAVVIGLVRLFAWSGQAVSFVRRVPFLAGFTAAVRDLERERTRLLVSFVLSVGYWLLVGVVAWIVAEAVDVSVTPLDATFVIMGTIFFATAVPAAPSAIGSFEWALVYLLGYFGISDEAGFGFAVVVHAVLFLPPTIIAALFLPREGIQAVRRRPREKVAAGARDGEPGR